MSIEQLSQEEKNEIRSKLLTVVFLLSERLKNLREMILKKESSRERLKAQAGPEWEKSKLAFVISSLITNVYDMKSCIDFLLKVIDDICHFIACLNGVRYACENVINLSNCDTYMHIVGDSIEPRYVKQKSQKWHELRKQALVTGSTMYDALGLRSLKLQNKHFDNVISNISTPEPPELIQKMMTNGSENEIHACATIAAKVLPVLDPNLKFFEEGCYPLSLNGVKVVISPDGSCREDCYSPAKYGIEIKCPFPGNKFSTPVHYHLPNYYVPQVLSEMKALNTNMLYFVSYSHQSTAVHKVTFDNDLWNALEHEIVSIYGHAKPTRPTRRSQAVSLIQDLITKFIDQNVTFVMELPSVNALLCQHNQINDELSIIYCNMHSNSNNAGETAGKIELNRMHEILYNADIIVKKVYQLTRNKASEILAFMISDLDRDYHHEMIHSVPIAYGLKGYSLPTEILRQMVDEILIECSKRGLYVPVCSFDGQWSRMVVRDKHNRPLTVLQLQKDVFLEAKQLSKSEIVKKISQCNVIEATNLEDLQKYADVKWATRFNTETMKAEPYIDVQRSQSATVYSISKHTFDIIRRNEKCHIQDEKPEKSLEDNPLNTIDDDILDKISSEIAEEINDLPDYNETCKQMGLEKENDADYFMATECIELQEEYNDGDANQIQCQEHRKTIIDEKDIELMLAALKNDERAKKPNKWEISLSDFKVMLSTAENMNKYFLARELNLCVRQITGKLRAHGIKLNLSSNKRMIINTVSKILGDGSAMLPKERRLGKVSSLKTLAKEKIKKMKKEHLNIIYAENIFPEKLNDWFSHNPFGKCMRIASVDCSDQHMWYSRPEFSEETGHYIFMILDAYHQICGARRVFCLKGMPASGINNKHVHQIADESDTNGCGLRSAMVKEPMLDRQSVAYAVATFTEKVQKALLDIGAEKEANFCDLIREWYRAEDEPGLSAAKRCISRLNLRKWLLSKLKVGQFPPCGVYIKDIPIVLFEGLLTGIERRIQLYAFTKTGTYNVRTIGSLDIENFFWDIQDMDPRGTGVMRPDDIATALSVAAEITGAKMNPERGFHMITSSSKVYPCPTYDTLTNVITAMETHDGVIRDLSIIYTKDHNFDTENRARGKRKRKLGNITSPEGPVRRPTTVREFHKSHEDKILPHVRRGMSFEECNKINS